MFGLLKKKLKKSIGVLKERVEKPEKEEIIEKVAEKRIAEKKEELKIPEKEEPKIRLGLRERIARRTLSEKDIENFFSDLETELLQSNIALEVIDFLKDELKQSLSGKPIKRGKAGVFINQAFREALLKVVDQGMIDLGKLLKENKPLSMVFLGFNGSGKTTSMAKLAHYFLKKGKKPVLAAGDTFRAASIEQLEHHGNKLGVRVIKHQYGSDSAAVVFDAIKHASSNNLDVVLADTAGRTHTNRNLMDELKKVIRVNNPTLKVLVVDSLTGNDAVGQARDFNEAVGVDAVVMTKTDVNEKGGSILSVCYAIKKPILFLGTGQKYGDMEIFNPEKFVNDLLS